jgi:cytochrome c
MRRAAAAITMAAAAGLSACGGGEPAAPEAPVSLAGLPAPYNTADYENGRKVFNQCRSCHVVAAGGPNLVGPNLHGVFDRKIGTRPDYAYSAAAKAAGFHWDAAQLDRWLTDPRGFLPGTKMTFPGVKDPAERRDVIAYLLVETRRPAD